MNKFIGFFLALFCAFAPLSFADSETGVLIEAQLIDNSPTSYTSDALTVRNADKVGFYVAYDETEVGATIQGTFTVETSYDGSNWIAVSFLDFAGGVATFVTSEVLTGDGRYYCWLHADAPFQYVRVKMAGTNTDADDTILTTVNYVIER